MVIGVGLGGLLNTLVTRLVIGLNSITGEIPAPYQLKELSAPTPIG